MDSLGRSFVTFFVCAAFLGVWWVGFAAALLFLVPGNIRGHTEPWGLGDLVAGAILVAGPYLAARYCRVMPLFFVYGVAAGLLYVFVHWPVAGGYYDIQNETCAMVTFGLWWLSVMVGVGAICRAVAGARHRRLDSIPSGVTNKCGKCGYLLYGLPEPRCPECGQPSDPAKLDPPPPPGQNGGSSSRGTDA